MKFEIYKGRNGKWFWRLKAKNHETIANGQGYSKKADCLHVIRLIKRTTKAELVDLVEEEKAAARAKVVAKRKTVKRKTAKKKVAKRKTAKRKTTKRKTAKRKVAKRKTTRKRR